MLRLFFSLILFCISCSIPSFAAITITIDSIKYSISNQEATVIKCLKKCKNITIPKSIENDIIVTKIASRAFINDWELESISLPGSIKRIENEAFNGCENLKLAELQDGVEIIERRAFYECPNLTLIIPPSVNTFGANATTGVKNIYISYKTPPPIDRNNIMKSYIYVPWGLKSKYMDSGWNQGLRILCYGSYPHIDVNLTSPGTLVHHFNLDSVLSIGSLKITGAINGTDLIAINKMKNLEEIDLSEATIVAGGLPYYQTDQESYYTLDDNLSNNSFYNIYPSIVHLPKVKVVESNSLNSKYLTQLSISNGLEKIGAKAFSNALITEIKLPSTLKFIGNSAFFNCKLLNNINLPTNLEIMEEDAFYNCAIQTITIPPFVTELTHNIFSQCKYLKYITIPQNIKAINSSFNGCNFSKMIIEDSTEELTGNGGSITIDTLYLGRNFAGLQDWNIKDVITIGANITTIPPSAFNSNCEFSKVSFHKSITSIGDEAFKNSSIKEVYSENPEPPEISENTFTSTVYANATLYVPSESLTTYWLHRYWGKFASIKPLEDQTFIQTPQVDDLKININGNSITVENSGYSDFQIFDISGKKIYHGKQSTVSNLSTGIYILKLGTQTKKFAITM